MRIRLPYGRSTIEGSVSDDLLVDVIELDPVVPAADPLAEVDRALADPCGPFVWPRSPAGPVAIAVNDKTRPVPHRHLLPPLLDRLSAAGVVDEAITLLVAVGGHPPMAAHEFDQILPAEIRDRFRVLSHDARNPDDLVFSGTTDRDTPVWINRHFADAAMRIVVGTIEPHQFVGYSGGVKSAAIGLAGLETIRHNHRLMTDPRSQIGTFPDNPARQDIEQIGELVGVDLALNAVLDPGRRIVRVLAGTPRAVMAAGVPIARRICQVEAATDYPVVIASPGGHPKDIDVYQSQKALATAARIAAPGGTIVLAAACPEGSGNTAYEAWVGRRHSAAEVLETFAREEFRIGPHKAFQLARDCTSHRVVVVSELPEEQVRRLLLDPAPTFQHALDAATADLGPGDRVAVLPHASTTVPDQSPS